MQNMPCEKIKELANHIETYAFIKGRVFFDDEKDREVGTSDTQLYKQAGNAVTVNVIQAIGQELKILENEMIEVEE